MDAGENMNPNSWNVTTDNPDALATPASGFSNLMMILQILLRMKKFHKPKHELEIRPNITWPRINFTTDGQQNPIESNITEEEIKDVKKIESEIPQYLSANENTSQKHKRFRRQAANNQQAPLIEMARLYTEIGIRYQEIRNLSLALEECKNNTKQNDEKIIATLKNTIIEKDREINALKDELEKKKDDDSNTCDSIRNLKPLLIPNQNEKWINMTLNDHFGPGSKIVIRGKASNSDPRMNFNLGYSSTIALHIDNRWSEPYKNTLVLNTLTTAWGLEEILLPAPIPIGTDFVLSIRCLDKEFKICINGVLIATYAHRVSPSLINKLFIQYAEEITSVYYSGHA